MFVLADGSGTSKPLAKPSSAQGKEAKEPKPQKSKQSISDYISWMALTPKKVLPTKAEPNIGTVDGPSVKGKPPSQTQPAEVTQPEQPALIRFKPEQLKMVSSAIGKELADAENFDLDDVSDSEIQQIGKASKSLATQPTSAAESAAIARQRLVDEEERFAQDKHDVKVAKAFKKLELPNQVKEEKVELSTGEKLAQFFKSSPKKEKNEKSEITKNREKEEAGKTLDKYLELGLDAAKYGGSGSKVLTKGITTAVGGDKGAGDIVSSAFAVAASLSNIGSDLLTAYRAVNLYFKVEDEKKSECRSVAMAALGSFVGDLVVLTKNTLNVAESSGALEAGSAVPILGIVAALPSLVMEANKLRAAINREHKQRKILDSLRKARKEGKLDASQDAVETALCGFIDTDNAVIAKGIAKVCLDFTKVAGHGVTLGGVTAPVGTALVVGAAGGKLLVWAASKGAGMVAAHQANEGRKSGDADKEISNDPQLSAQLVLDQALRDGPGSAAYLILKSFGVKPEWLDEVSKDLDSEKSAIAMRNIRQKVLFKQDNKDKKPETAYRSVKGGLDSGLAFLTPEARQEEIKKYRKAKNLLNVGGKHGRGKGWDAKLALTEDLEDVEEQKKVLLEAFERKVKEEPAGLEEVWLKSVRDLLAPRPPG